MWSVDYKPVKGSTILCTGSEDGSLKLWDTRSNKTMRTFDGGHSEAVYCVRWSADGAMIASGSEDTKVCDMHIHTKVYFLGLNFTLFNYFRYAYGSLGQEP